MQIEHFGFSQSYTSLADGAWTTPANWNNTGGYGTSTPPLTGYASGTITMKNNMTISTNYVFPGGVLNIAAGKTLTVSGNLTESNGAVINVSGTLVITGDLSLSSNLNILPGGKVIVNGNVVGYNSNYLVVGTNAGYTPYADLVIQKNLSFLSSGDATFNQDSRVAVYGNVTDDGSGGTTFQVNNGSQVYVNGKMAFTGGSDQINNANTISPYGLYVNSTTTNTGGGHSTTANEGNKATMQTTNPTFYSWVASQPNNPLPVTLASFKISKVTSDFVMFDWATSSELNFDYFSLERSSDGAEFYEVAKIQGHGTTTVEHTYSWTDNNPLNERSYYRLKSVDINGYTETFSIGSVDFTVIKKIDLYPNPVASGSSINGALNFNTENPVNVVILDMSGNTLLQYTTTEARFSVPVYFIPGTYVFKISTGDFSSSVRVLVQ